jgi:hypothetical protein
MPSDACCVSKMPWSWSTNRALRCVKLFNLIGISMFIIIIID